MNHEKWRQKTDAKLFTESEFIEFKKSSGLFLLGVMGFASNWSRAPLNDDSLELWVQKMKAALETQLLKLQALYGKELVMVSGATNRGTLQVVYEICREQTIAAMAIAPNQVLQYELAEFEFAVPVGDEFGDESETFVSLCDVFLLLGGGPQSKRETIAAHEQNKTIVVIQGFGGVADEFEPGQLPNAQFIRHRV